jgi:predicted small metal-binding protein
MPSNRGHGEERITSDCAGCGEDRGDHTIKTKGRPKRKDPVTFPKNNGTFEADKKDYHLLGVNGQFETRCSHPGCRYHVESHDEAEAIRRIEQHARTHKHAIKQAAVTIPQLKAARTGLPS